MNRLPMLFLRATSRCLPLAMLLFLRGMSAFALEPEDVLFFKAGPLSLRPQVSLTEIYSDNIFYQENDAVTDFMTAISPGLKLQLGRPEHNNVMLSYTFDQLFYIDNSELNTGQHTLLVSDQFQFDRLKIEGSDRIRLLSNPLSGVVERIIDTNGVATIVRDNVDRLSFDDTYTVSYDVGEKTGVYVRGSHYSTDYEEGITLYDIRTLTGTAGFGYRAFPKTIFFGEAYYGQTKTDPNYPGMVDNPRLDFMGGYVGARGDFTPKLSGVAKVGYESREFADGSSAPSEPVANVSLTYLFSPKRSLSLTYSRQNTVSVQYSRQTYTADAFGLQFNQWMGTRQKWQASLGASYSLYEYDLDDPSSSTTNYDYFRGSFNLAYRIQRWLTAICGYDFEMVSGDTAAVVNYNVNRVTFRLAVGY